MAYLLLTVVRFVLVLIFYPLLYIGRERLSVREAVFLSFAGLRGGAAIALALSLQRVSNITNEDGKRMTFIICGIVALTLIINAVLATPVLKQLKIISETADETLAMSKYAERLMEKKALRLFTMLRDHSLPEMNVQVVLRVCSSLKISLNEVGHHSLLPQNSGAGDHPTYSTAAEDESNIHLTRGNSMALIDYSFRPSSSNKITLPMKEEAPEDDPNSTVQIGTDSFQPISSNKIALPKIEENTEHDASDIHFTRGNSMALIDYSFRSPSSSKIALSALKREEAPEDDSIIQLTRGNSAAPIENSLQPLSSSKIAFPKEDDPTGHENSDIHLTRGNSMALIDYSFRPLSSSKIIPPKKEETTKDAVIEVIEEEEAAEEDLNNRIQLHRRREDSVAAAMKSHAIKRRSQTSSSTQSAGAGGVPGSAAVHQELVVRMRLTLLEILRRIYQKTLHAGVISRYSAKAFVYNNIGITYGDYCDRESGISVPLLYSIDVGVDLASTGLCDWPQLRKTIKNIRRRSKLNIFTSPYRR